MTTKKCSRCGEIKDIQEFDKRYDRISGIRSECKQCRRKRRKIYEDKNHGKITEWKRNFNKNHKNEINAKSKLYRDSNKEHISNNRKNRYMESDKIKARIRNYAYLKTYGITLENYEELFNHQNGVCAICGQKSNRRLDVDHDHATNKVRGLLCNRCNSGIGLFRESPFLFVRAILYLENHYE